MEGRIKLRIPYLKAVHSILKKRPAGEESGILTGVVMGYEFSLKLKENN